MSKKEQFNNSMMKMAIQLAKKRIFQTFPNPAVGCVIVKHNKVISTGHHKAFGSDHAEIDALKKAGKKAQGASMYVSLEPCIHFGKTPPCADAIIRSGIKEVFIAIKDPNPINAGKGINKLRKNAIKVSTGLCRREAAKLNSPFTKYIKHGLPFVILKIAQSIDGKIATKSGDSKWISCPASRKLVHDMRKDIGAVMVGVNTILKDNPFLTVRASKRKVKPENQPIKIIVDSMLKTPVNANIFSDKSPGKTIIATTNMASKNKIKKISKKNTLVLFIKTKNKKVDLTSLMKKLLSLGIFKIMIEGGSKLAAAALKENLVDKIMFFTAPKIIGGLGSKSSVAGKDIVRINSAIQINNLSVKKIGSDFLFQGDL